MGDIGEGTKFSFETVERLGIIETQSFKRDDEIAFAIKRLIDNAEAARAQPALDGKSLRALKILIAAHRGYYLSIMLIIGFYNIRAANFREERRFNTKITKFTKI